MLFYSLTFLVLALSRFYPNLLTTRDPSDPSYSLSAHFDSTIVFQLHALTGLKPAAFRRVS
jgi:hypothetical protein